MRALLASSVAALFSTGALAATEGPLVPPSGAVDHVVTMGSARNGRAPTHGTQRITHHAGWSRIEQIGGDRAAVSGYVGHAPYVSVSVPRWEVPGNSSYRLEISRWPQGHPETAAERAFKTGERRVVLGEECEIWNVVHVERARFNHVRLSCISNDGIELATRTTFKGGAEISSAEAISVERRRVHSDEAHPPAGLLNIEAWVRPEHLLTAGVPKANHDASNYEVILQTAIKRPYADPTNVIQTKRRYGAWTYTGFSSAGSKWPLLEIENVEAGFGLYLKMDIVTGLEVLTLIFSPPEKRVLRPRQPTVAMDQYGRFAGEVCQYFNMRPNGFVVTHECRTRDGLMIKEDVLTDTGDGRRFEAVEIRRGGMTLPSILSEGDVLDPARWGLPR